MGGRAGRSIIHPLHPVAGGFDRWLNHHGIGEQDIVGVDNGVVGARNRGELNHHGAIGLWQDVGVIIGAPGGRSRGRQIGFRHGLGLQLAVAEGKHTPAD